MKRVQEKARNKHPVMWGIITIVVAVALIYLYFGGFGTGQSADVAEFSKYASAVDSFEVPGGTRIVALGEATHGNKEFQELKLDVFKRLVEKYRVKAFVLEADAGCCMKANQFVQGGEGTADEAAAMLGFRLYRTYEMAELLSWMREYNMSADDDKLTLYGFDMQRIDEEYSCLMDILAEAGYDTDILASIWDAENEKIKETAGTEEIKDVLEAVEKEPAIAGSADALHMIDVIRQNMELGKVYTENANASNAVRDKMMAENTLWVLAQEEKRGNNIIFISGHNGHVEQFGAYNDGDKVMGNIIADEIGDDAYFVIGTDFYKTRDNVPTSGEKRTTFTAFSHDPLAKAAKKSGNDICMIDFSRVSEDSSLRSYTHDYIYTGSIGEVTMTFLNRFVMKVFPMCYRVLACPADAYDAMIFVAYAHPTEIRMDE